MKDIENIEDWYRDELNNYNVEPDQNGWNSLAEDLDINTPLTDNNISEWYKKEATKLEERPDFIVWEKISTNLDTVSVWDKLAVSLNRYELFIWWRNLAFKGVAVAMILFGSYLTYNNYTKETFYSKNNKKNTLKRETTYGFASLLGSTNKLSNTFSKKTLTNITGTNKHTATNILAKNEEPLKTTITKTIASTKNSITNKTIKKDQILYASNKKIKHYSSISAENLSTLKTTQKRNIFTDFNRKKITERDISHIHSNKSFLVKKDKNKILFNQKRFAAHSSFGIINKRIYIGANLGLKKQGLITHTKENSALSTYKQKNLLDFGTNFGGVFGIVISNKLNIETNINFNSTAGYKRAFSTEGIAFQENLNMNYTSINLLAKKMNSRSTFDNRIYSTNLIGGIYTSYLRTAVSDINGATRNLDQYNRTDVGIVLGIEQDRHITQTLVITPGIRYNQGLINIANENNSFESARNFSLEFNLGIKYIFIKSRR